MEIPFVEPSAALPRAVDYIRIAAAFALVLAVLT